ncbi:MAG: Nif11-like leader peptide family natural product precursor [Desulfobacterales bacterium]|jgi:predicted ribosomally synthesized peptide with nif11-like leader|nr:Nif11-like leader peptide family natural product precursor [Desulfobacterales bacterium]MDP7353917.1 Nif11-like leader peptide family natural product precursor [Desulfobacterales bacterium]|tara:strand:- start:849 stop:1112 length:264 start_codon:yes stop_codon:yes gene_type:complete
MSKENFEQFMKQVAESDELKARISDEIDSESLIALGAEQGYEFTAEDLNGSVELSDKELDKVAGGARSSSPGLSFRCWSKFPGRVHD